MTEIAILASGRGTNFDAILEATRSGKLKAKIVAVLSDRPAAPVLEKARKAGIPALSVPVPTDSTFKSEPLPRRRELHDEKVLAALAPFSPRFLVMAGYMRIVSEKMLGAYQSGRGYARITNIHPSLLPAFPGVDAYAQAFEAKMPEAGVTVHLVEGPVDAGPICAQESFSIKNCRSAEEVEALGLKVEHRLYPETLAWVLEERFTIVREGGLTRARPN